MSEPYLASDYALLAKEAERLHADAVPGCDAAVRDGKLTEQAADELLRPLASLAAIWRRLVDRARDADAPSASRGEILAALERARSSAARSADDARASFLRALQIDGAQFVIDAIEADVMTRQCVWEQWKARRLNYPQIPILFAAERRLWVIEALLWHAKQPLNASFFARLTDEVRARSSVRMMREREMAA